MVDQGDGHRGNNPTLRERKIGSTPAPEQTQRFDLGLGQVVTPGLSEQQPQGWSLSTSPDSHRLSDYSWKVRRSPRQYCVTPFFKQAALVMPGKGWGLEGVGTDLNPRPFNFCTARPGDPSRVPHASNTAKYIFVLKVYVQKHSFHVSFVKRHFDICA